MDDPLGRTLVGLQATLFVALAVGPWLGTPAVPLGPAWGSLGGALMLLGATVVIAAAVRLGPRLSPFPRPRPGHDLVTDGVYRLVRHPIYGGVLLAAVGWTLLRPAVATLAVTLLLWLLLEAKSRYEERSLRCVHPAYDAYRRGTRRFVPFLY